MPTPIATLTRLHAAYAAGVYRFLLTLLRDAGAAQDVLQEVFVKLARDASGLLAADSEQAWLFKMARHAALDWRRRHAARARTAKHWRDLTDAFVQPTDPDAAAWHDALTQGLAHLPDDQRTAVHLHLWQGLTFREIALIQDVPLATAASRYRYGIQTLRTILQPLYSELA